MEEKPFKFEDPTNRRLVTNIQKPNTVLPVAGAIFAASVFLYSRKIFRVDKNALNLMLFSGASAFASYSYASFIMSSPIIEAGLMNNEQENKV